MAKAKVVDINVDKKNGNISFKVAFEGTSFRASRQKDGVKVGEFPERKDIDFEMEGTLPLSDIVLDYCKKRKIDLTSELEKVVENTTNFNMEESADEYEAEYTKLVKQVSGTTVNAETLKVEPEALKKILAQAKPEFHDMVRAAYATHGEEFATQFVEGTPGVKA